MSPVSGQALKVHKKCKQLKDYNIYTYVKEDIMGLFEDIPWKRSVSKLRELYFLYFESMNIVTSCEAFLKDNPYVQETEEWWNLDLGGENEEEELSYEQVAEKMLEDDFDEEIRDKSDQEIERMLQDRRRKIAQKMLTFSEAG